MDYTSLMEIRRYTHDTEVVFFEIFKKGRD